MLLPLRNQAHRQGLARAVVCLFPPYPDAGGSKLRQWRGSKLSREPARRGARGERGSMRSPTPREERRSSALRLSSPRKTAVQALRRARRATPPARAASGQRRLGAPFDPCPSRGASRRSGRDPRDRGRQARRGGDPRCGALGTLTFSPRESISFIVSKTSSSAASFSVAAPVERARAALEVSRCGGALVPERARTRTRATSSPAKKPRDRVGFMGARAASARRDRS